MSQALPPEIAPAGLTPADLGAHPLRRIPKSALGENAADDESVGRRAELSARAEQIGRLTWKQYEALRDALLVLGLPAQIAAITPWLAADPQTMLSQLKRPRRQVIAAGITGVALQLDVVLAALVRALENLRMGSQRYQGAYSLPECGSTTENNALTFDLSGFDNMEQATQFLFDELDKVDAEIDANNPYGDDIRANGVRVGGILFPLLIALPGQPQIGCWETADCYGRAYFIQESEGIDPKDVLDWMREVPTNGREFSKHPLQVRRNQLLAIAGKVTTNTQLSKDEETTLLRAVMPNTTMVIAVDPQVPMDEVRRRVVSQKHLDRPTPFSMDTDWQTRAAAVLSQLQSKDQLVRPEGVDVDTARSWLDRPWEPVQAGDCFGDDIAMIAIASLLLSPNSPTDRVITAALRTRGVTGALRTTARTELVAHVIARAVRTPETPHEPDTFGDSPEKRNQKVKSLRDSRRSALERALVGTAMRDMIVDMRPISELLDAAHEELAEAAEARSRGTHPELGPATRQIAARAAFHLTCGAGAMEPLLRRSSHGAGQGKANEPAEILRKLALSAHGIEQLAQAILDGRRGHPIRLVAPDARAEDHAKPPAPTGQLTDIALRDIALSSSSNLNNPTAAGLVARDTDDIRDLVHALQQRVDDMATRADDMSDDAVSYVDERGWRDPYELLKSLAEVSARLKEWNDLHKVLNRVRPTFGDTR